MIRGINWFGFETEYSNLMCTWNGGARKHIDMIDALDFNYIRLPFSLDFIERADWAPMDEFFDLAEEKDLKVLLDFHRLENTHQSPVPYNDKYSFEDFLQGWIKILDRYETYSTLEAVDIFNEYQGDNYVEWNSLARQIVSYIENAFPNRFQYYVGGTNWGGNLHDMDLSDLPFFDRIRYTIHKYWFSDSAPYDAKWDYSIKKPVMTGEFGYMSGEGNQVDFAYSFVDYLIRNDIRDTFFWTWSYNSGDTKGILMEDCETVDYNKMDLLHHLWYSR